ncbi:hypothetical protein [Stutzerimonas frequens]|uniref:hypothetical protein n=1 Tax=Stutzerimonas frequens TaxID=2968969 RepID=UPI004037825E
MKRSIAVALSLSAALLTTSHIAFADEVIAVADDHTAGKAAGTITGVMLGAAAGGPLGALAGAGLGWLAGWGIQSGAGLSETAYAVRGEDGETALVRSPNQQFAVGDQVDQSGRRLRALGSAQRPSVN